MTTTTSRTGPGQQPGAHPVASDTTLDQVLQLLGQEIEPILASMPSGRLEARRLITRELGSEPRPELLQTIVGIAQDNHAHGVRKDLPRRLLATYVLADRELRELFGSTELDPDRLAGCARTLPGLVERSHGLEDEVGAAIEGLPRDDRDYLLHVADSLTLPQETLIAAALLAPRLELLIRHARSGDLERAVPSLDRDEATLFLRAAGKRGDEAPSRVIVDAIALRTIIDEDMEEWHRVAEANPEIPLSLELRREFQRRLERDRTAYHVISARLQRQQDSALVAGLDRFADEMRDTQRRLFSTYLKLAPTLRSVAEGTPTEKPAEKRPEKPSLEMSFAEALAQAQQVEQATDESESSEPGRSRTRLYVLLGVATVLIVAVITAYTVLPAATPEIQELTPADFTQALFLEEIVPVGPLVYAKVKRWAWDNLEKRQRLQRVALLGDLAARRGFEAVYLVDENDERVASWTEYSGTKVVPLPQEAAAEGAEPDPAGASLDALEGQSPAGTVP